MHKTSCIARTVWLRTDRAVVPTNTADWHHLLGVEAALHRGVFATPDAKRPEFYDFEVEGNWYYVHIPSRIAGVYLIAARRTSCATASIRDETALTARC